MLPGNSPGTLTVRNGDLVLRPGSNLVLEIGGTAPGDFDVVNVENGTLLLEGGSLDITFSSDFVPVPGAIEFTLVTTEDAGGALEEVVLAIEFTEENNEIVVADASLQAPEVVEFSFSVGGETFTGVTIDIKPGSDPNSINLSSAGVIPVAILSSVEFDATSVDPDTIELAGARVQMAGKSGKSLCHLDDVDNNNLTDLVCQVQTEWFMIAPGADVAVLKAETFGGEAIIGRDDIRIVQD